MEQEWEKKVMENWETEITVSNTEAWGVSASIGVSGGFPLFQASAEVGWEYSTSKSEEIKKKQGGQVSTLKSSGIATFGD